MPRNKGSLNKSEEIRKLWKGARVVDLSKLWSGRVGETDTVFDRKLVPSSNNGARAPLERAMVFDGFGHQREGLLIAY